MADKEIVIKIKQEGSTSKSSGGGGIMSSLSGMMSGGGKAAAGAASGIGGALSGILGAVLPIAGIVGALGILISASKMLERTFGNIFKSILMIIRPIGDILSIIFMPLMLLLRPLGLFINALFRPFITEARKVMMTGMKFLSMGMKGKAAEAFGVASQLLAAPIIKILILAIGEGLKLAVDIIFAPFEILISLLGGLGDVLLQITGASQETKDAWTTFVTSLQTNTDLLKESSKSAIDEGVTILLEGIDDFALELIAHGENLATQATLAQTVVSSMKDAGLSAKTIQGEIKKLDEATDLNFAQLVKDMLIASGKFGTDFPTPVEDALNKVVGYAESAKAKIDALLAAAESNAASAFTGTPGGKYGGGAGFGGGGGGFRDFIMRPNSAPVSFSPDDTVVGVEDISKLSGGQTVMIGPVTIYAQDAEETKRKLDELIQESMSKLR